MNKDENNPNSFCSSSFAYRVDNDYDASATIKVLSELLREPVFNQLRTKEQLGYIVSSGIPSIIKVLHFTIQVQSSVKDADYLEHRINDFLLERKKTWIPSQQDLERVIGSIVNNLKQQDTSLVMETQRNWDQILDKEL